MCATFPAHLFLLDSIILIVSGGAAYSLCSFLQPPVTSTLFVSKYSPQHPVLKRTKFHAQLKQLCFHTGDGTWRVISCLELPDARYVGILEVVLSTLLNLFTMKAKQHKCDSQPVFIILCEIFPKEKRDMEQIHRRRYELHTTASVSLILIQIYWMKEHWFIATASVVGMPFDTKFHVYFRYILMSKFIVGLGFFKLVRKLITMYIVLICITNCQLIKITKTWNYNYIF
jgi:hypothetical protein